MTWLKSWGAEGWREGAVILECDLSVLNEGDYRFPDSEDRRGSCNGDDYTVYITSIASRLSASVNSESAALVSRLVYNLYLEIIY
jgi:hypothetical protein